MKKYLILSMILLSTTLLAGCAAIHLYATESPKVELIQGQWITLPKPSQLSFNIVATQILTAEYTIKNQVKIYTSQVQVEKNPQHLILVVIAGWGGEMFSIDYDGTSIKTISLPMPNADIGIQHVLTDFILIYANADLLKKLLKSTDISLISRPYQRVFMLHNKPIIKIDYQNVNPWKGNIILHNFKYNYVIKILTISQNN